MEPAAGGAGSNVATLNERAKRIKMTALIKRNNAKITFAEEREVTN